MTTTRGSGPAAAPPAAVPPPPAHLQLEVTSACNLSCAMCLVSHRPRVNRHDGALPWEVFTRLVDGAPGLRRLTLQGLGEPLLHPRLPDMVAYAKERGVAVGFNTNAMLLTRPRSERLVALGVDWLHVSVDAASPEVFAAIRSGGDLDRVLTHLAGLVDAKRAAGTDRPRVRVVTVAMRRNLGELGDLVRRVAACGVDEVRVQGLSHDFDDTDPAGAYAGIRAFAAAEGLEGVDPADVDAAFAEARAAAAEAGVRLRLPRPARHAPPARPGCDWPWTAAYVTSAGTVQPCCMVMGDDRVAMGSVADATLAEVWAGEAYGHFRAELLSDTPPAVCAGCSLYRGTF